MRDGQKYNKQIITKEIEYENYIKWNSRAKKIKLRQC